jgi:hypothetical protein
LQRQCAARNKQREEREQAQQGQPQGAAPSPVTPGKRAGVPLSEALAKRMQYTAAAAVPAAPAFSSGLIPQQQQQQQQVPFNSSSMPVAVAAPAASAPAPVAADSHLLRYLVKHSSEEGKRASEKLEEKMTMLIDVQAQITALTSQRAQLDEQVRSLRAEVNCFRKHCKCCAREKAAAVRDATA